MNASADQEKEHDELDTKIEKEKKQEKSDTKKEEEKIFNDPVHGPITLPSLCVAIIDTPQFQRLRNLKQLGGTYYVYPGASHNRFEHSIGVCHLAGELVKKLQSDNQQDYPVDEGDVLCVQIAGLCHDLGHGPLSHLFDKRVIPELAKLAKNNGKWTHEDASLKMFDYMLDETSGNKKLITEFNGAFTNLADRKAMIKLMIKPPKENCTLNTKEEEEQKRIYKKKFLFQIVANEKNKIDVDKWDYFARDCHHLGMKNNFDHRRLIKFARVIGDEICYRDKEENCLYEMFHTREVLHRRAYQHKTSLIVEHMIADAMIKAYKYLTFMGVDELGERVSRNLYECITDMVAYTSLDDTVLSMILNYGSHPTGAHDNPAQQALENARGILIEIQRREHHRFVHSIIFDERKTSKEQLDSLETNLKEAISKENIAAGIVIVKSSFDFGREYDDPMKSVHFYSKSKPDIRQDAKQTESNMRIKSFREDVLNFYKVYTKNEVVDEDLEKLKRVINEVYQDVKPDNAKATQTDDQSAATSESTVA